MAENDKGDKYEQLRQVIKDAGFNPDDSFKPHLSGTGATGALYNPQTGGVIGTSGSAPGKFDISNNVRRIGDYVQDKQGNWNVASLAPLTIDLVLGTTDFNGPEILGPYCITSFALFIPRRNIVEISSTIPIIFNLLFYIFLD